MFVFSEDICFEKRNRYVILFFDVKHCKERKTRNIFLALNFRLAVNMLQLIYALKKHNNCGFPTPSHVQDFI
jgi:hypothetical protein